MFYISVSIAVDGILLGVLVLCAADGWQEGFAAGCKVRALFTLGAPSRL